MQSHRTTLHKPKPPTTIKMQPVNSIATQLKVIEDFLGPGFAAPRLERKPAATQSNDPALQCLMSLYPEEARSSKPSGSLRSRETLPISPIASTSTVDIPRSHPRPQPNPNVQRLLAQPTLLGRSTTQLRSRRISATISSNEVPAPEDKTPDSHPMTSPPTTPTAVQITSTSLFYLERPIGAKMAEIWYADRDRRRQQGQTGVEPRAEQVFGEARVSCTVGGEDKEGVSTWLRRRSSCSPSDFTHSVYSQDSWNDSSSSTSSSSTIQTPSTADVSTPVFIRDADPANGCHPDDCLAAIPTKHSVTLPLNIAKRASRTIVVSTNPPPNATMGQAPTAPTPAQHRRTLSEAAIPPSPNAGSPPSTNERPCHALARGGSSRPRPRARSNAEASSNGTSSSIRPSNPIPARLPSTSAPVDASSQTVLDQSEPDTISALVAPAPSVTEIRLTRPRSRTIAFAPLPTKSMSVPPTPPLPSPMARTSTRPSLHHCPSSWNAPDSWMSSPSQESPTSSSTSGVPGLNTLLPAQLPLIGGDSSSSLPTSVSESTTYPILPISPATMHQNASTTSFGSGQRSKTKVIAPLTWVIV